MRTLNDLEPLILSVLERYPVAKAGVFGSYARGKQRADSDIDILVEFESRPNICDNFFDLWVDLEDILKMKVDLIQYHLLKPDLQKQILEDEVRIFDRQNSRISLFAGYPQTDQAH